MSKKRKQQRRREQSGLDPTFPARYGKGIRVRVKPGTTVPEFADIPLGGWAGTISEIDQRSDPPTYLIEWNQHTLDHMHPVYRKRCERDGLILESMWLGETDLEPDPGELAVIEQPTNLITRPLSKDDQDDRIRAIFDLTSDDPLPFVQEESLRRYHRHLATHLAFPFQATDSVATGPFEARSGPVTVSGLLDPDECDTEEGLLGEAMNEQDDPMSLPLTDIEATINPHNRQLLEDYAHWFTNHPGEVAESSEPQQWSAAASPAFSTTPRSPWSLVKAILTWGVVGALCGTVFGALWAATEIAKINASVGAVLVAFFGGVAGAKYGKIFGAVNHMQHGALLVSALGSLVGGLVGALLGAMVVALGGTVVGGIVGGLVGRQLAELRWRPIGTFKGILLGAGIGAVVQAVSWDQENALTGAILGAGVGAVLGALLWLAIIGFLAWVIRSQGRSMHRYIP